MESSVLLLMSLFFVCAKENATVGKGFHYVIDRNNFAFQNLESSNPVTFRPSLYGKAGLPSWLKYYQQDTTYNGYLYGTPQLNDVGNTNLEIIGLNRATYKTARVEVVIAVQANTDSSGYMAAFNITNKNLDELLSNTEQNAFLEKTSVIWPNVTLVIYSVSQSGKRTPSSENPDKKRGVVVTVASSSPFSNNLKNGSGVCNSTVNSSEIQAHVLSSNFEPEYLIDWCYFNLVVIEETLPTKHTPIYLGGDFDAPEYTPGRIQDIRQSFYIIVVMPIIVAFIFSCLLGYLMFCRREGVLKRNVNTPEEQLIYHKNIKKSTKDLRKMNNRRNQPGSALSSHPGSPSSIYQPRFRSNKPSEEEPLTSSLAANPETSPPIYRLPPVPAETSFIEPRMSPETSNSGSKPAISRKISSPATFHRSRESTA